MSDSVPPLVTVSVQFRIAGDPVRADIPVPAGKTLPLPMLPAFRQLAEIVVDHAVQAVRSQGKEISCKKGCGACCRQLVPISALEARRLRDLVNEMPEPRRSEVSARLESARSRLEQTGMLEQLLHPETLPRGAARTLGLDYFRLGIACPFLEEESCSIYHDRPIACREYLVTSPAENCAKPSAESVECVPVAAKVSNAVAAFEPHTGPASWVPLIVALEWAEAHPATAKPRPGPEWLRDVFDYLAGKQKAAGQSHALDAEL